MACAKNHEVRAGMRKICWLGYGTRSASSEAGLPVSFQSHSLNRAMSRLVRQSLLTVKRNRCVRMRHISYTQLRYSEYAP